MEVLQTFSLNTDMGLEASVISPSEPSSVHSGSRINAGIIAGIVIVAVFASFCIVAAVLYCRTRRTNNHQSRRGPSIFKRFRPEPLDQQASADGIWATRDEENPEKIDGVTERTPDRPPQVQLSFS